MKDTPIRSSWLAEPLPDRERLEELKARGAYGRATHVERGTMRGQPIRVPIDAADFDWLVDLAERALVRERI